MHLFAYFYVLPLLEGCAKQRRNDLLIMQSQMDYLISVVIQQRLGIENLQQLDPDTILQLENLIKQEANTFAQTRQENHRENNPF